MYKDDSFLKINMAEKEKGCLSEIKNQIKDVDTSSELYQWSKCSIYELPFFIKDLNPKAYKPQVISFGPFHCNDPQLRQMEVHKHRAVLHFFKRVQKSFDEFVSSLEDIVQELQDTYQFLDEKWKLDKDEFLKLMIVDGCFMLEMLKNFYSHRTMVSDYAPNDPIFSNYGMLDIRPYIKRDMLMIENQLPLKVLGKLMYIESGETPNEYHLNTLVLNFCAPGARPPPEVVGLGLHPLDLYRKFLILDSDPYSKSLLPDRLDLPYVPNEICLSTIIPCVMELKEAGVSFKNSCSDRLVDISFDNANGVLRLLDIVVDDTTEFIFLNLMAFERLHLEAGNEIRFFVFFMNCIMKSAEDVALLNTKGFIQNILGSDEAIVKLFNSLAKEVNLDFDRNFRYVQWILTGYCRRDWNRRRAYLIRTYFRNPWSGISFAASLFLLVLTVLQTLFTVLPYCQSDSPAAPSPTP